MEIDVITKEVDEVNQKEKDLKMVMYYSCALGFLFNSMLIGIYFKNHYWVMLSIFGMCTNSWAAIKRYNSLTKKDNQ